MYDSENEGNILSGTVTDAGLVLKAYYTPYINVKSNSGFTMADNGSGGINVQAGNSGCMMLEGSSTNFTLEATFHATDTNFHVGFVISDGTNTVYMLIAGRLLYIQNGPTWNNRVGGIVLSNQALMASGSITVRMTYEASDDINTLGTLTFYIINEGVPTQAGRVTLYQMNNEKCEEGETLHGIANATTPLGETGLQTTFEAGASLFCGFGGYQPVSGNPYITDISWTDHTASEAN